MDNMKTHHSSAWQRESSIDTVSRFRSVSRDCGMVGAKKQSACQGHPPVQFERAHFRMKLLYPSLYE